MISPKYKSLFYHADSKKVGSYLRVSTVLHGRGKTKRRVQDINCMRQLRSFYSSYSLTC